MRGLNRVEMDRCSFLFIVGLLSTMRAGGELYLLRGCFLQFGLAVGGRACEEKY